MHKLEVIFTNYSIICQNEENSYDIVFLPSTEGWSHTNVDPVCKALKGYAYVEDNKSKQEIVFSLAKTSPYSGIDHSLLKYKKALKKAVSQKTILRPRYF